MSFGEPCRSCLSYMYSGEGGRKPLWLVWLQVFAKDVHVRLALERMEPCMKGKNRWGPDNE